jgi:nucleotide-binding universal stress UspA family protein
VNDASGRARDRLRAPDSGRSTQLGAVHLVLGYDASPASQSALAVATDLAGRLWAQLHVVHAIALTDYPIDPDRADWEEKGRLALAAEREVIETALRFHSTGWTYHEWRGDPARLLCQLAEAHDALMVIVGIHHGGHLTGLHRMVTGSVSRRVTDQAHCPVLVVPHHEARV